MNNDENGGGESSSSSGTKWLRGAVGIASSAVPFPFGPLIAAAAGAWSESEQEQAINALRAWVKMLEEEMKEKQRTIIDIMARLDLHDERIAERIRSSEYQSLLKVAFRNWAGTESRKKQEYIRNILTHAASVNVTSDDVIRLFIKWLQDYSELHFVVIADLYKNPGSTRGETWTRLGKGQVREDSADADLYRLLVRDLSTGGIIRQHRETDYAGNFLAKKKASPERAHFLGTTRTTKSAFDDSERYELTALGQQFVHYAMTEVTVKIEYHGDEEMDAAA